MSHLHPQEWWDRPAFCTTEAIPQTTSLGSIVMRLSWEERTSSSSSCLTDSWEWFGLSPLPVTVALEGLVRDPLLKGTTPLDDFRKKYICAFLPMELRTYARAQTPKPLELRWIFSFFFQVWKHGMLFFCARGIILCSGDGHLVDKAAFRTFWATD